jgi:hypothetical protein
MRGKGKKVPLEIRNKEFLSHEKDYFVSKPCRAVLRGRIHTCFRRQRLRNAAQ